MWKTDFDLDVNNGHSASVQGEMEAAKAAVTR